MKPWVGSRSLPKPPKEATGKAIAARSITSEAAGGWEGEAQPKLCPSTPDLRPERQGQGTQKDVSPSMAAGGPQGVMNARGEGGLPVKHHASRARAKGGRDFGPGKRRVHHDTASSSSPHPRQQPSRGSYPACNSSTPLLGSNARWSLPGPNRAPMPPKTVPRRNE